MKPWKSILMIGLILFSTPVWATLPAGYVWKKHILFISAPAPPALMYVVDSQGNQSGGDPSKTVTPNGMQPDTIEAEGMDGIPFSEVEQSNENGDGDATGWSVYIFDAPKQTYTLNLKGLAAVH